MSDGSAHDIDRKLDAYLDGLMEPAEREAFEREIDGDAALRAEVDAQSLIDDSLKRVFEPPAAAAPSMGASAGAPLKVHWTARRMPASVAFPLAAAAVLIFCVGSWQYLIYEPPLPKSKSYASMSDLYHTTVQRGFTAHFVCENDRQFATAFNHALDQPLLPNRPEHVAWVGLSRSRIRSQQTVYILLTVSGREVLVFVERYVPRAAAKPAAAPGLYVHARRLNQLMLYEVTPSETSEVLDLFYEPDIPDDWKNDAPYW